MCITWATSCATAEKTSADGAPDATSVATRRNAACSSTSRCSSLRGSAGGADVLITSRYPIIVAVSTSATRVVLADDEVLMREGLAGLLERSGFEVVGQSGNASELIELVRELRPDLVIVAIRRPPPHRPGAREAPEATRGESRNTPAVALPPHV